MEEWDKHMRSFVPDDMISFTLEGMTEEVCVFPFILDSC